MVLPKPNQGERRDDFISRCMGNSEAKKEFPDNEQRLGVCFSQFRAGRNESVKRDAKGRLIVAENVPIIIGASIRELK